MKNLLLLVLLIAAPSSAWDRYETLLVAGSIADLVSTENNLRNSHIVESNSLMENRAVRYGTIVAHIILTDILYRKLKRDGQDGFAKLVILTPTVTHSFAAGWNVALAYRVNW